MCEFGRQEILQNSFLYILLISHVQLLVLLLQISVDISGCPFNITNPSQDGRIWNGKPTQIVNHPHQVRLLN
jgi:hypothetical protein